MPVNGGRFFRGSCMGGVKRHNSPEIGRFYPMAQLVLTSPRERESLPGRIGFERECALAGGHIGKHGLCLHSWLQKTGTQL